MMPSAIYLDLSELVATPLRTGIQRVEREAIRHWPGPATLVPCRVEPSGQLLRLPDAVLKVLCATDDGSPEAREAEGQALRALVAQGEPLHLEPGARLLNLELFFDADRAEAHMSAAAAGVQVMWYVYDFLPFLRPDLFPARTARHCMHFLRALRGVAAGVGGLAFLSAATRADYATRVAREPENPAWPVISPGADGIGLERQHFSPNRRDFVSIGTVEARKNQISMLRAFESLWATGSEVRLVVAGKMSPNATEELAFFARHAGNPRLQVLEQPADATLRDLLRGARALVMPSEAEGFGLPPYEALHAGIPSIASTRLPSVAMMPRGLMLLEEMTPKAIAAAVEALCDDDVAARLWAAAADLQLSTWATFGHALGRWAQDA